MNRLFYLALFLLTLFSLYFSSSLVRLGEVNLFNDVARDFLLLQELDEKKVVLIGPRSNTNGLFHGPLWTYMNYPAYLIGNGNPVVVAWFWVILGGFFVLSSFYMVKKMFGVLPAFTYIALTSIQMAPHINGIFHAEATFFFIPMLFFTICMYMQSKKKLYLALHFLALSMLIQLEVGVGIQFLMLSTALVIWFIYRYKLWKHILVFSLIPIFLSNLIIFDLRNNLRMAKAIFSTGGTLQFFVPFGSWIENRVNNTVSLQLFNGRENNIFIYIVFAVVIVATILLIKNKNKYRYIYFLFAFYYFGYMILSFFNKGTILFHYVYLLIPLTSLWLVSFLATKYRIIFLPLIVVVVYLSFIFSTGYIASRRSFIGTSYNSWISLSNVAKSVIDWQKEEEFGYFVFAPDAFAYQPRYAMIYHFKKADAKAFEYTKKPITYIIAAPPPGDDPYMTHVWWRKTPLRISSEPAKVKKFPSGFTIEKLNLSLDEQRIPHDKNVELRIHFR
ncbi:MAG: hypothetical protein HYW62_02045 [Candidatus Levybacteria bacterium]|nr:hypothetical protein [Candidatus Levybacteria bacterium]